MKCPHCKKEFDKPISFYKHDEKTLQRVLELKKDGKSYRQIQNITGVDYSQACRWVKRLESK